MSRRISRRRNRSSRSAPRPDAPSASAASARSRRASYEFVASFFSDGKLTAAWHHVNCLFDAFVKQRATTRRIEDPAEDVKGWELLSDDDKKVICDKLEELEKSCN